MCRNGQQQLGWIVTALGAAILLITLFPAWVTSFILGVLIILIGLCILKL